MKNPILNKFNYKSNEKINVKGFNEINWQEFVDFLEPQELIRKFLAKKHEAINENKDLMKLIAKLNASKDNNSLIENNLISMVRLF